MAVPDNLRPTYTEKILRAMKAERSVERATFGRPCTECHPGARWQDGREVWRHCLGRNYWL